MDSTGRLRCLPRIKGMAQNAQLRLQPSAILTYALCCFPMPQTRGQFVIQIGRIAIQRRRWCRFFGFKQVPANIGNLPELSGSDNPI